MLTEEQLNRICIKPIIPPTSLTDLPDTYPWTDVLRAARKPMGVAAKVMGLQFIAGAIFTGPVGNGRHTTAWALANTLCKDKDGYKAMVSIHSDDLDFEDREDVFAVLNRVIRAAREAGSLIVLLEHCGENPHSAMLQRHLLRLQRGLSKEKIRIYLIVIADNDTALAPELSDSLPRYHCAPPDKKAVKHWAETIMKKPVPIKIKNKTAADIAKAVQGLSWKQLHDLHNHLLRLIVLSYSIRREELKKSGVTEEEAYKQGLITLPEEAVNGILTSYAAQRTRTAVGSHTGTVSSVPPIEEEPPIEVDDPIAIFTKSIGAAGTVSESDADDDADDGAGGGDSIAAFMRTMSAYDASNG